MARADDAFLGPVAPHALFPLPKWFLLDQIRTECPVYTVAIPTCELIKEHVHTLPVRRLFVTDMAWSLCSPY
jgi:hypothetical protein